jgi:hypothetical protein
MMQESVQETQNLYEKSTYIGLLEPQIYVYFNILKHFFDIRSIKKMLLRIISAICHFTFPHLFDRLVDFYLQVPCVLIRSLPVTEKMIFAIARSMGAPKFCIYSRTSLLSEQTCLNAAIVSG